MRKLENGHTCLERWHPHLYTTQAQELSVLHFYFTISLHRPHLIGQYCITQTKHHNAQKCINYQVTFVLSWSFFKNFKSFFGFFSFFCFSFSPSVDPSGLECSSSTLGTIGITDFCLTNFAVFFLEIAALASEFDLGCTPRSGSPDRQLSEFDVTKGGFLNWCPFVELLSKLFDCTYLVDVELLLSGFSSVWSLKKL